MNINKNNNNNNTNSNTNDNNNYNTQQLTGAQEIRILQNQKRQTYGDEYNNKERSQATTQKNPSPSVTTRSSQLSQNTIKEIQNYKRQRFHHKIDELSELFGELTFKHQQEILDLMKPAHQMWQTATERTNESCFHPLSLIYIALHSAPNSKTHAPEFEHVNNWLSSTHQLALNAALEAYSHHLQRPLTGNNNLRTTNQIINSNIIEVDQPTTLNVYALPPQRNNNNDNNKINNANNANEVNQDHNLMIRQLYFLYLVDHLESIRYPFVEMVQMQVDFVVLMNQNF